MNIKQQELLDRLKRATNIIWGNPESAAQVALIFEDFVSALEEIADDLATTSDEQVARDLREIMLKSI